MRVKNEVMNIRKPNEDFKINVFVALFRVMISLVSVLRENI